MRPNIPSCKTAADAQCMTSAWRVAMAASLSPIAGKCRRACHIPKYTVHSVPVAGGRAGSNESRLMVYFANFGVTLTTEYLTYDFSAIVSAVGGSLGLFLGFSCLDGAQKLLGLFGKGK